MMFEFKNIDDLAIRLLILANVTLPGFTFLYVTLHKELLKLDGLLFLIMGITISGIFLLSASLGWLFGEILGRILERRTIDGVAPKLKDIIFGVSIIPALLTCFLLIVTVSAPSVNARALLAFASGFSLLMGLGQRNQESKFSQRWKALVQAAIFIIFIPMVGLVVNFLAR